MSMGISTSDDPLSPRHCNRPVACRPVRLSFDSLSSCDCVLPLGVSFSLVVTLSVNRSMRKADSETL